MQMRRTRIQGSATQKSGNIARLTTWKVLTLRAVISILRGKRKCNSPASRPFSQRTVQILFHVLTAWAIWSDGWIWLTLVLFRSTICLILLRVIGKSQWARWWNMTDQSQPNPTQLSDQIVHPAVHVNMDLSAQCCKCNPKLKFGISAPAGHGRPTESGSEP